MATGKKLTLGKSARIFTSDGNGENRRINMRYGFHELDPGESQVYRGEDVRKITNAAYYYAKRWGRGVTSFSVRQHGEEVVVTRMRDFSNMTHDVMFRGLTYCRDGEISSESIKIATLGIGEAVSVNIGRSHDNVLQVVEDFQKRNNRLYFTYRAYGIDSNEIDEAWEYIIWRIR